ncbi:hypothetical protein Ahy_B10g101776 [Arachis hypogaea]|uniref:Transposase MuDR plant domain-containing protein n=1 Tax=Arachis hypogaea TaxID=3818 RepID=A0A444X0C0_ARAHY|nr:hypothetical protein Ahy_B10g101776 [Arachis hypogaea]
MTHSITKGSYSDIGDTESSGTARTNMRKMMIDLNIPIKDSIEESHERSAIGGDPITDPYQINPISNGEKVEEEPEDIPNDKEETINYYTHSQLVFALTQPCIYERYDHLAHLASLNLDAMNQECSFDQGGPKDDPTNEFEVRQQFEDKQPVLMVVKIYNITRNVEYKILESDHLKYYVHCTQFRMGC